MVAVSFNSARHPVMVPITLSRRFFYYMLIAKKYHKVTNWWAFWSRAYVFTLDRFN